jgi:nucleotidyltransferase substrate binding protein (TIGR01987 family)
MMDYSTFRITLTNLDEQYNNLRELSPEYPTFIHEGMAESVIQRFEICYDTAWKALRRHLLATRPDADAPNSPKPILRIAAKNMLLAGSGERWQEYADMRTRTTHIYDGAKAAAAVEAISTFIADAIELYCVITGETWE